MKKIRLLIPAFSCLLIATAIRGQEPLQWDVQAQRTAPGHYVITVSGSIAKGWHIYAQKDTATGLEPLRIEWPNENVHVITPGSTPATVTSFKDPLFDNKPVKIVAGDSIRFSESIQVQGHVPASLAVTLKAFASDNGQFLPVEETKEITLEGGTALVTDPVRLSTINLQAPASSCGRKQTGAQASLLAIFIKGFGGGLLTLLMPCLFPMIPVTVSFFTKKAKSRSEGIRHALLYGLSILSIYLLISLPFHLLKGVDAQIFNTIATNAWVNLVFFGVFVLFALSLFGVVELRLPSSFSNRAATRSGIFFMALTLTIVSFSCTGPILGALLANSFSDKGSAWQLTMGLGGFGTALALPFTLFAVFPQGLKSLPRSGGWMEVVKKSLAFVELGLAIKFLSNADLVEHWGILKRELFIGVWMLVALLLALYLFGFLEKNKRNSSLYVEEKGIKKRRPWGRLAFGALSLAFAVYLIPGIFPSPAGAAGLRLISGFPPPLSYSIYHPVKKEKGREVQPAVINDFEKAVQLAKQEHKPVLIDFTGWACVNCRKMEEQVWTDPAVKEFMQNNFVLVSLYVDDRKKLEAPQQFSYGNRNVTTVGDKWALFQTVNFGEASQPMYVVVSPDEKLMNLPVGYTDADEYRKWLQCGWNAFQQQGQSATKTKTSSPGSGFQGMEALEQKQKTQEEQIAKR